MPYRLQGEDSHWFGYLQSLPQEPVDLALFWGADEITDMYTVVTKVSHPAIVRFDSQEAMTWITGTELEKEMRRSTETGQTLIVSHDSYS